MLNCLQFSCKLAHGGIKYHLTSREGRVTTGLTHSKERLTRIIASTILCDHATRLAKESVKGLLSESWRD